MEFAAFSRIPPATASALPLLEAAESQGYHGAWLGDPDHASDSAATTHLALAGFAAKTRTIGITAALTLRPSAHPLRLAEEIAMLEIMSGGRFRWSAAARSTEDERSTAVFREQLEVVRLALSGERFSFAGEFFEIPELACLPAPESQPHPLPALWLDGPALDGGAAAAPMRDYPVVVDPFVSLARAERARELGKQPLSIVRCIHVGESDARARAEAEPALHAAAAAFSGSPDGAVPGDWAIVGDAARCRELVAELLERTDADTLVAWQDFGGPAAAMAPAAAAASQRRLIEDIAPTFS